jgi:hypothetical protein
MLNWNSQLTTAGAKPHGSSAVSSNFIKPKWNPDRFAPVESGRQAFKMEGVMENWTNAKWCDVANLILGAILFFSPWMFGFEAGRASENANIAGIAIVVLAIAALAAFAVWEEWLNLIVGLWALVAPWVLGFQGTAIKVHVIIGAAVAILAALELWIMSQNPPRLTASH